MKPIDILKQSRVYRDMAPEHLEKLAEICKTQSVDAGVSFVQEGAHDNNIYVLSIGSVKVLKKLSSGEIEEVARLGSGATSGEMAFLDNEARSTTVETVERTEMLILPGEKLKELLGKDVGLRAAFYEAVAKLVTRRLRGVTDNFANLRTVLKRH